MAEEFIELEEGIGSHHHRPYATIVEDDDDELSLNSTAQITTIAFKDFSLFDIEKLTSSNRIRERRPWYQFCSRREPEIRECLKKITGNIQISKITGILGFISLFQLIIFVLFLLIPFLFLSSYQYYYSTLTIFFH